MSACSSLEGFVLGLDRGRLCSFTAHWTHLSCLSARIDRKKLRQAAQVDHRRREREDELYLLQSAQLRLAQDAVLLAVAEYRFDQLSRVLAQRISGMACRAFIDAARSAGSVLRHVR